LRRDSFSWNEEAESAFDKLKEVMSTPPVLGLPDSLKPFVIEYYASGGSIGVVLMQGGRPLAYLSQATDLRAKFMWS
jgi:hypothetical protein